MRIAIITGASSGLGREFAVQMEHFYKQLDEIWVIARRKERLEALEAALKTNVRIFAGDLEEELVCRQVQNRLENQNPDVRMLVNAAGFGKIGTVEEIVREDMELHRRMIAVNCQGVTQMCAVCLPYMSRGSRIINVASAAAFCPQPGFAVYAATKSYVVSFSKGLAQELKEREIFVTAVCPGPVDTEFFKVSGTNNSQAKQSVMADAPSVVRQALLDARAKKRTSIYGSAMKGAYLAAKLLPEKALEYAMKKIIK